MPIPTRSHSVRGLAPSTEAGSRTRITTPHESTDEVESQTYSSSRSTSTLPRPRKVVASGLPRGAGGHARTQSASIVNASQLHATRKAVAATGAVPPRTASNSDVDSKVNGQGRLPSTSVRSGHLRSQSTAIGATQRSQSGLKPAFDTYTQHFSPLKARHDAPSALRKPDSRPSSGTNATLPQLAGMRDELLQLTLVHARSHETLKQFTASASSKSEARAVRIRREEAEVAVLEQKLQEDVNVHGLVNWLGLWDQDTALEHVRTLSAVIQKLSDLTNEDGDFVRVMQQFEGWETEANAFLVEKSRGTRETSMINSPVNELPAAWHQIVGALKIQLNLHQQSLRDLGGRNDGFALGRVISGHQELASTLSEELELCTRLHSLFMGYQQEYNAQILAQVLSDANDQEAEPLSRKPLWQSLCTE